MFDMRLPLVLTLATSCLAAAESAAPRLRLDAEQAVALALERNGDVFAAGHNAVAANQRARALLAIAYPRLTVFASGELADGTRNPLRQPGEDRTRYGASGEASQLLWAGGLVGAALRGAASTRDLGAADLRLVRRDLASATRDVVSGVHYLRDLIANANARIVQRESERDDAAGRVAAGAAAASDRRQSDLVLATARDELMRAESRLASQLLVLAELIAEPGAALDVTGALQRPAQLAERLAAAQGNIARGPELAAFDARRRGQLADADSQRARRWPMFSAFAGGGYDGAQVDDLDDGWQAGLRLEWSIYDGGERLALNRAANQSVQALAAQAEVTRLARQRAAADLRQRAASLDGRITLQREVIALAEADYADVRGQYQFGTVTRTRVNEANLAVFEARFVYASLVYEENLIDHAAGRLSD